MRTSGNARETANCFRTVIDCTYTVRILLITIARLQDTYAKYAEVRHRLGFLFRSRCILPGDIKPRRSFMDSVCRTFAGLLERRRRVLITSYKFHRLLAEV